MSMLDDCNFEQRSYQVEFLPQYVDDIMSLVDLDTLTEYPHIQLHIELKWNKNNCNLAAYH
ncbi:hypothetical protein D3C74_402880 [compost metagenome]